ncbi:MAG TPA: hypothetical protein VIF62_04380 [Labilithrix sp.]|jgi:hypothetical protein
MNRTLVFLAFGALLATGVSCASSPDKDQITDVLQPDFTVYANSVDFYLQRRCGTLDCHGQAGRAYRIYGQFGFRLYNQDAGLVSGQQPTTPEEVQANFQAIVSLEPEELSRVVASQGDEDALKRWIWIRKPLRLERHKGGPAMAEDDSGYKCVLAWMRVATFDANGNLIPPQNRTPLSDVATAFCKEAQSFP